MSKQKKLIVKKIPVCEVDELPDIGKLQAWEDALNGSALADFSVVALSDIGGYVWCVLEKEV